MKILPFLFALCLPGVAISQIACFEYAGGVISCDSPSHNTTIAPLGPTGGIITEYGSGRNTMEPYTIITPEPRRRSRESAPILAPALPSLYDDLAAPSLDLPSLELPGLELP